MNPLYALGGVALSGLSGALSAWGTPRIDTDKAATGAFSNAFGEIGGVAANRAKNAFDNLGNTAGARLSANNLNNLSAASLGGLQSTSDSAAQAALANFGNTRRGLMNANMMSGGTPASLAGMMGNLSDANAQTANSLAQQNSDSLARAIAQASSNASASQSILQSDLSNQHNIARSQLADFNPTLFQANIEQQSQPDAWQGFLQGSATAVGSLGSRLTGNALSSQMSTDAMRNSQQNVLTNPLLKGGGGDWSSMFLDKFIKPGVK